MLRAEAGKQTTKKHEHKTNTHAGPRDPTVMAAPITACPPLGHEMVLQKSLKYYGASV